ncbi:MAG: hypothetical protein HY303_12950 [Candidatus Wallbacteria bacterium]|nr:hypothetical protein [Candidatus Wallbacteria bacterium]
MPDLRPPYDRGRLRAVPICHYQMEYAAWVRFEIERYRPEAIAVELPSTLRVPVLTAVRRLPFLSVVLYEDAKGGAVYLPIEPCDAACEALRSGQERSIPVHLVDLDVDDYPLHPEPMPDPYVVHCLGLGPIWGAYREAASARPRGPLDSRREQHMAYWLDRLLGQHERVLFVCGMAHVEPVLALLGTARVRPAGRVTREGVRLFNLHPESAREVMGETPFVSAVYERWRAGAAPLTLPPPRANGEEDEDEPSSGGPPHLRVLGTGAPARPPNQPQPPAEPSKLERGLLELLHRLFAESGAPLKRGLTLRTRSGLAAKPDGPPGDAGADGAGDASVSNGWAPPSLRLMSGARKSKEPTEKPTPTAPPDFRVHDGLLPQPDETWPGPDRQHLLLGLLRAARARYRKNTREKVQPWQARTLLRFLRRYALSESRLLPDFFQTLVAARACVDDNYAYEVWDLGSDYPFIDRTPKLATIEVRGEEIWLGMRKIRFRRRIPDRSRRKPAFPLRKRAREKRSGEWREKFRAGGICSYPPEDVVVEDFGRFLKKKAGKMLSEERSRVEPFTTSLRDGLDLRETVRNWHDGRKLYVREAGRVTGGVGAVVMVFDEDARQDRFPWLVTWWGEHDQESDLAFYATAATQQVVGPGVARCQYGGFMMTHPPGRLYDIWSDPFYDAAESKSERMLMAAVDYSLETHVVYVAAKPPRSRVLAWARRLGKKIVYVPIGGLSPVTLKKLRVFHVLSDHTVREVAKDYVF